MDKQGLKNLSDTTFPTNGTRRITAANLRGFNNQSIDSMYLNPGSVIMWAGTFDNIPQDWAYCDGRSLPKADYPALFQALGADLSPWGSDNLTFKIPLLEELQTIVQATRLGDHRISDSGGEKECQLTIDEMPRHNHGLLINTGSGRTPDYYTPNGGRLDTSYAYESQYSGGNDSHNNMPPYVCMYYIIKIR